MAAGPSFEGEAVPTRSSDTASGACGHCGDSLVGVRVVERAVGGRRQSYCCLGCAFIAEQLSQMGAGSDGGVLPEHRTQHGAAGSVPACAQLDVRGMVCSACALLIEHRLRAAPGVHSAHVDFVGHRALLVYDPKQTNAEGLSRLIEATGYRVARATEPGVEQRASRIELLRVLLAWLAMMQVMMLAIPEYLAKPGEIPPNIEQMLRIAQLILTVPVAVFCAAPFWRAASSQLRTLNIGMDVPVAVGLAGALAASIWATAVGRGPVYFDSVTMFVALLLAVRWWQLRTLARATAEMEAAARQTRLRASRLRGPTGTGCDRIDASELVAGDRVVVALGEAVPADGRVLEGTTSVSQAWLTGESRALEKHEGDSVLAGSLNLGQPIIVRVMRSGDATSLAALQRTIIEASGKRPRSVEIANRIASVFSPMVLLLAVGAAVVWMFIDPSQALRSAIAVLVVTCPCALSLANPLAVAMAQSSLAAHGVLLTRPAALESLARVDTVVFDKTGTLTDERLALLSLQCFGKRDADYALALAAGLEAHSNHPVARALDAAARARGVSPLPAIRVAEVAGMGIEGIVGGTCYRLGRAQYALALTRDAAAGARALSALARASRGGGAQEIVLADAQGPLALLQLGEALRDDARQLVGDLAKRGLQLLVVSGDQSSAVERLARALSPGAGRAIAFHAEQTPSGKLAVLEGLQTRGHRVAMVGDGINDAPILAQADASIALASGSALAQARADIIVLGPQLYKAGAVFDLAPRTIRIVRGNYLWAAGYNLLMLPLAAAGMLAPWLAAAGMALSAGFVLANSMRLRYGAGPPR